MKTRPLQHTHLPLALLTLLIASVGLLNLHSATYNFDAGSSGETPLYPWLKAIQSRWQGVPTSQYFWSQGAYNWLGFVVMLAVSRLRLRWLYRLAPTIYGFSLVLLVAVLALGVTVQGSQSWLVLGGLRLQPSEFAKLGLVLMLARILGDFDRPYALVLAETVKPLLIFLVPMGLVILQNDLGSSLFFGLVSGSLLLIQGIDKKLLVIAVVLVAISSVVGYHTFLKPYQQQRILRFMQPETDARGSGYHLVQSKIAVGSGGVFGKGYLRGESNKLKFLPERHTDFVFPVLAEEWGFMGSFLTLTLYFLLLAMGMGIASRSTNRFGFFLTLGIVAIFFWQLVVNLGGVLGLMPLTGVTLPFLSYGGSSLIANWVAIGLLLAVYRSRMSY